MPLLVALLMLTAWPGVAHAADWARPVRGDVVEAFTYDRTAPFARGAHRGTDLTARAGETVRAPCAGVVTFAGRVPSRGAGVTIRCGALVATLLELGATRVARGQRVSRGERVGRAARGVVHLGARRAGDRFGYVDPARLIKSAPSPPLGPAPPAAWPRSPSSPRPGTPRMARPRPATPRPATPRPAGVPVAAWVGLGLVVAGVPVGAVVRWRRRGVGGVVGRVAVPR